MDKEALVRYIEDLNIELLQLCKTLKDSDTRSEQFEAFIAVKNASHFLESYLYPTAYYDELYLDDELEEDVIE